MAVQQKIKEYLNNKGIKYQKVYTDIGMSANTFSQIMNGIRVLKADEFFAICKSLEVSPDVFDPDSEVGHETTGNANV